MMHLKEEIGRYRHEIIINDGSCDFIKDNIISIFIDKIALIRLAPGSKKGEIELNEVCITFKPNLTYALLQKIMK
jgi:hypothetical protein